MKRLVLTLSILFISSCHTSKKVKETELYKAEIQTKIDSLNLEISQALEVKKSDVFNSEFEIELNESDSGTVELITPNGLIRAKKNKAGKVKIYGTTTNIVEQKEVQKSEQVQFQKKENSKLEMQTAKKNTKETRASDWFSFFILLSVVFVILFYYRKYLF